MIVDSTFTCKLDLQLIAAPAEKHSSDALMPRIGDTAEIHHEASRLAQVEV